MSVGKHSRSCNDIISCLLALAFWSWSFTWIICVIFCFYDEKYLFWGRKVDNKSNWVLSSSIIWWKTHKACFEGLGESGRSSEVPTTNEFERNYGDITLVVLSSWELFKAGSSHTFRFVSFHLTSSHSLRF